MSADTTGQGKHGRCPAGFGTLSRVGGLHRVRHGGRYRLNLWTRLWCRRGPPIPTPFCWPGQPAQLAAAISMMAGTYLDVESTNDRAATLLASEQARLNEHGGDVALIHSRIVWSAKDSRTQRLRQWREIFKNHPQTNVKIGAAVDLGVERCGPAKPRGRGGVDVRHRSRCSGGISRDPVRLSQPGPGPDRLAR